MDDAPADTRQQILQAAAALFLERGVAGVSMEQVRLQAGVSNGSLYHHFGTKPALLSALYEQSLRAYHAAVLRPLESGPPAEDGVRALVQAHLQWVLRHPQPARVLHELRRAVHETDAYEPAWGAANADAFQRLERWRADEQRAGRLKAMPLPLWLALVFAPVTQLGIGWAREGRTQVPAAWRCALADAAVAAVCE